MNDKNTNELKKFGKRIRVLRLSLNLTQEELSFNAELDRTYISAVERGRKNVSLINISKLIRALNSSFEDFFKDY